jgi:hypothetical protein
MKNGGEKFEKDGDSIVRKNNKVYSLSVKTKKEH